MYGRRDIFTAIGRWPIKSRFEADLHCCPTLALMVLRRMMSPPQAWWCFGKGTHSAFIWYFTQELVLKLTKTPDKHGADPVFVFRPSAATWQICRTSEGSNLCWVSQDTQNKGGFGPQGGDTSWPDHRPSSRERFWLSWVLRVGPTWQARRHWALCLPHRSRWRESTGKAATFVWSDKL